MSTVKELADGLRAFDDEERKWWKVTADEEQHPPVRILTKKNMSPFALREEQLRRGRRHSAKWRSTRA